ILSAMRTTTEKRKSDLMCDPLLLNCCRPMLCDNYSEVCAEIVAIEKIEAGWLQPNSPPFELQLHALLLHDATKQAVRFLVGYMESSRGNISGHDTR
ncbi:MAG: hypothetical protein VW274_07365, partial [Thalassolituus sp.]